jgi:hypothetical protein
MATTATRVVNFVAGNKKFRIYDIAFSGSYQDDGSESSVTAAQVGLKKIEAAIVQAGAAAASALTTANPVAATVASTGASVEFTMYEDNAAAAAAPLTEKTDNEAFITGQAIRCLFIGH